VTPDEYCAEVVFVLEAARVVEEGEKADEKDERRRVSGRGYGE